MLTTVRYKIYTFPSSTTFILFLCILQHIRHKTSLCGWHLVDKDQIALFKRGRFPFMEIRRDGNEPGASLHLFFQMWSEFDHFFGCCINEDNICISQIGFVIILPTDLDLIPKSACDCSQPDQRVLNRADFKTHCFCAKVTSCDEENASIPCAKIVEDFIRLKACQLQ